MSAATELFGSKFSMVNSRVTLSPGRTGPPVNVFVSTTGPMTWAWPTETSTATHAATASPEIIRGKIREPLIVQSSLVPREHFDVVPGLEREGW
jgi:hypothetical protein